MVEESINTSQPPEITAAEEANNVRRSSVGKPTALNGGRNKHRGNSRILSTRKPTFPSNGQNILPHRIRASTGSLRDVVPNSRESVIPHYLRASTGSCHDFCKHGKKHAVEVKARVSIPKRIIAPLSDIHNNAESRVQAERKTTKAAKSKPSLVSKTLSHDSPNILKEEVLSPSKKDEFSSRQASLIEKKKSQKERTKILLGKLTPTVKPETMTVKPLSSPDTSGGLKGRRNSKIKMGKKMGSSKAAVKKVVAPSMTSLPAIPSIDSKTVSLNGKKYRSLKLSSHLKDQNTMSEAQPKQPNSEKVVEKTLHVINVETENKAPESTQSGSTSHSPPSLSLPSPKLSSLPKSPSLQFHEDQAQEEFEYTDSEEDEYDDSISESSGTVNMNEVETSEADCDRVHRKSRVGVSEDKHCAPVKLKFRRGKVVDLKSENSGPRRLRFRRGRVLGENQDSKADIRQRNFLRRGVVDDDDDTDGTDADSRKVVLRHQDVQQEKKDAQGLLNNVIEEAASKLVETRKSKVMALVGAFETVISLQESKHSTQIVS